MLLNEIDDSILHQEEVTKFEWMRDSCAFPWIVELERALVRVDLNSPFTGLLFFPCWKQDTQAKLAINPALLLRMLAKRQ